MKYLKGYKKEYGVLYLRPIFPKEHKLYWLNYVRGKTGANDLDNEIKDLSDRINTQYSEYIVLKLDDKVHPGCATTPDMIEVIANDIYVSISEIYERLTGEKNVIRLVWGIGEMEITKSDVTLHHLDSFPILIKVGHELDDFNETGIFKV